MEDYRRRPSNTIVWTRYEDSDNWVVHIPAAALVHLFTDSAYKLWTLISEDPGSSSASLVSVLARDLGRQADESFAQSVKETLALMDSAGLIEPALL